MGGEESKPSAPPPPRVVEDPYPLVNGLTNLSVSGLPACANCDLFIDTQVSTASVTLTRDYGDINSLECQRYDKDLAAVRDKQMSFQDFLSNLQSGSYSRPVSEKDGKSYCEQVMLKDEDAAVVNNLADFEAKAGNLKSVRIRKVTSGGSFSSGTKAKFAFSIPIKIRYVSQLVNAPAKVERKLGGFPFVWQDVVVPGATKQPVYKDISVSAMTLYHPSPIRIENIQHDAVLSLNDPGDGTSDTVILIPLKGSNLESESESFFGKIVKHIISVSTPDSVSGKYQRVDIPTGSDWNIKQIFTISEDPTNKQYGKIDDSFYTWIGSAAYTREKLWENASEIRYGWKSDGKQVRYFMLGTPVSISLTDLSLLTRNLPPTPVAEAMHKIPETETILYKLAQGKAASASCGIVRERMENPGELDLDLCDPFAMNAKSPNSVEPTQLISAVFYVLMLFGVVIGTWLAMYMVTIDYDVGYKDFSETTGKVVGMYAKKINEKVAAVKQGISDIKQMATSGTGIPSLSRIPGVDSSL